MFPFENFPVYLKSEAVLVKLHEILKNKAIDKDLKDQLRRASTSILLNIAEGSGKFAKNDKKNFYLISRGSVNECVAILRILRLQKLIDESVYIQVYNDMTVIGKMLSGLINAQLDRK